MIKRSEMKEKYLFHFHKQLPNFRNNHARFSICAESEKFALFSLFIREVLNPDISLSWLYIYSGSIPKRLSLTLWQRFIIYLFEMYIEQKLIYACHRHRNASLHCTKQYNARSYTSVSVSKSICKKQNYTVKLDSIDSIAIQSLGATFDVALIN